jgi:general secretion pathway protein J
MLLCGFQSFNKVFMQTPSLSRQYAFTLLELMLALVLSVTVLTLLAGGMYGVLQDWERSGERLDDKLDMALSLLQLEQALTGAFPFIYRDEEENKEFIYFIGENDELTWVSTVSPSRSAGLSAWLLTPGKDDKGLKVKIVPAFTANPEEALEKTKAFDLLTGYEVGFEYLYVDPATRNQEEPETEWLDAWQAEELQSLPIAVRLSIEKDDDATEVIAPIPAYQHNRLPPRQKPTT